MIQLLLLIAGVALIGWLCAIPILWSGKAKASYWTAGTALTLGLTVSVGAMSLPRYSKFWVGSAGHGDGFGLIGLFIFGGICAGIALVLLLATAIIANVRLNNKTEEVSE